MCGLGWTRSFDQTDAPVILHPDPEVPLGHVIDLYDLARLIGFAKIQFAASEKI